MLTHPHLTDPPVRHRLEAPPPVLGFGILRPGDLRHAIAVGAAGVISGSAIVRLAAETTASPVRVASFLAAIKDAARPAVGKAVATIPAGPGERRPC